MELLSFTYLLIDLSILGLLIFFAIFYWPIAILMAILLILYPFIYEPILWIIYKLVYKIRNQKNRHLSLHKKFESKNNLVYNPIYNMRVFGIEKQHPFDACKYENIMNNLTKKDNNSNFQNCNGSEDPDYPFLYSHIGFLHLILINYSCYLSKIVEIMIAFVPASILRIFAVRRFLHSTQGSITASCLAVDRKWAINLGGGYHHANKHSGSGFCPFNDIILAVEHLWQNHPEMKRILIIDLDAHQGNGHERDKIRIAEELKAQEERSSQTQDLKEDHLIKRQIFIADAYNCEIYPGDSKAKQGIDIEVKLRCGESDTSYLKKIQELLDQIEREFHPDYVIYNAGTDIISGDRLGRMNISGEGIIKRDELVFEFGRKRNIPILMVMSGGYQKNNAEIIANSIINLNRKFGNK